MKTHGVTTHPRSPASSARPDSLHIPITGMSCAAETVRLEKHLGRQAGITDVVVNPVTELAYVTYDPAQISPETIRQEIRDSGFQIRIVCPTTP